MPSKAGRPQQRDDQDARQALIEAACLHFASHGARGSSNRQIALDAGVTPAMVSYYFKRREDLYLAVLDTGFAPLLEHLARCTDLTDWVHAFHANLLARPWLPHVMMRDVLPHDGEMRGLFMEQFASRAFGAMRELVARALASSPRAGELDVDRHLMLLMGMLVYPFLGLEVGQSLTGRKFDSVMLQGFRDDALALFFAGTGARP